MTTPTILSHDDAAKLGFVTFNKNAHLVLDLSEPSNEGFTITARIPGGEHVTMAFMRYGAGEVGCVDIQHHHSIAADMIPYPNERNRPAAPAQRFIAFTGGTKSIRGRCSLLTLLTSGKHHEEPIPAVNELRTTMAALDDIQGNAKALQQIAQTLPESQAKDALLKGLGAFDSQAASAKRVIPQLA